MEPTVKAALLCDYALTSDDGKLSVIGVFGNMNFASLPASYPRFFVVLIVTLAAGSYQVRLGIIDPLGQQLLSDQPAIEVQVEISGADTNLVVDFNNLPFSIPGIHQVQLYISGRLLHSIPLNVAAVSAPGGVPGRAN